MSSGGRDLYGKDSISRADYSNPYDLRPEADLARRRLSERNIGAGPDELESESTRAERSLTEKFQKNQFTILRTEKMGGLVTGGKFILLAFVMPAYLFFYGIPRWLLQNTFPAASSLITQAAEQIQGLARFVSQWSQNIFQLITNKVEAMFGWNRGSDEAKQSSRGWTYMAWNSIAELAATIFNGIKGAGEGLVSQMSKIAVGIYHFVADPVLNFLDKQMQTIKEIYEGLRTIGEKGINVLKNLGKHAFEGIKSTYEALAAVAYTLISPVVHYAVKQYQGIVQGLSNGYNAVSNKANDLKEWTENIYRSISHQITRTVKDKAHRLWETAKGVTESVAAPFIAAAFAIQQIVVNLAVRGYQIASNVAENTKKSLLKFVTKTLPAMAAKLFPRWLNPLVWYKKGGELTQSFKKRILRIAASALVKGRAVVHKTIGIVQKVGAFIGRIFNWIWKKIKKVAVSFYSNFLKPFAGYLTPQAIGNGISRTWNVLQVIFRFTKRLGQELISDITS